MEQAPLSYEASAGQTNLSVSPSLPDDVVQCLKNARFLHLATCTSTLHPHVSLMNYTYLPSTPYTDAPTIIMTTNPSSQKTQNLISNPNVSLLVHDWVSHRPTPSTTSANGRTGSPPPEAARSSLAMLLTNLNTSALSSISATINGAASLVERGTEEEKFLREAHLQNNTFDSGDGTIERGMVGMLGRRESLSQERGETGDGGRGAFVEGQEVRVLVVRITDGRVADWKGNVRDWKLSGDRIRDAGAIGGERVEDRLTNGV